MSVTAAPGFVAAGESRVAIVATADSAPVTAAGVFTQNKLLAAPVIVSQEHLAASRGHATAVVLNSGNANAATGDAGVADARTMAAETAHALGCLPAHVLVCSTGLIGIPLPMDHIVPTIGKVASARTADGADDAALAIMTTDTKPRQVTVASNGFTIGGMAKGAAMLSPNMATMLAVLTTDATVEADAATDLLRTAVDTTFNRLTVDGAQSTNDTVLLLAAGTGGSLEQAAVTEACTSLATQMAEDAEGHTKVVRVRLVGAASDSEALHGARRIADCQLIKCSWAGEDAYWGRLLSEIGVSGIDFDRELASVAYGETVVARGSVEVAHDADAVASHMAGSHIVITVDLGLGDGTGEILTNDLSHGYVEENMGTS